MANSASSLERVKVCTIVSGKTNNCDKKCIAILKTRIEDLSEVTSVEESDVVVIFCPIVSRAGTDIDAALKNISYSKADKLTVLVVLHHTFDPEKTVPESSSPVNMENTLTVDCLFYEDELLDCQKNTDSFDKVEKWLKEQRKKNNLQTDQQDSKVGKQNQTYSAKKLNADTEVMEKQNQMDINGYNQGDMNKQGNIFTHLFTHLYTQPGSSGATRSKRPRKNIKGVKVFSFSSGKTNNCDKEFIATLKTRIEDLSEAASVEESDIVVISCPIVSRAGTDIDAALKKINYFTESKLTVLVVYHHTFDPEKTVPDSNRSINKKNLLAVDCLFYEDTGLLNCQKNEDAKNKAVNWLITEGTNIDVKISSRQKTNFNFTLPRLSSLGLQGKTEETSGDNELPSTSSRLLNYFVIGTEDTQNYQKLVMNALKKELTKGETQGVSLTEASSLKESDVIMMFCPDIGEYSKRTGKPVVLFSLNHAVDSEVQKHHSFDTRRDICPVDCIVQGTGLLECKINREELNAVSGFLTKDRDH